MGATLRFAVVSDLHAHDAAISGGGGLFLNIGTPISDTTRNPVGALLALIEERSLRADALVCAGDLTDKAQQTATNVAWAWLQNLGQKLGDAVVVATTGNHDLDSRHMHNKFDPKGLLQALEPGFPVPNDDPRNNEFWSKHFTLVERQDFRVLTVNSAAFHEVESEITHGRISDYTLTAIRRTLEASPAKRANILVCHHHPLKHRELTEDDDYEVMRNGELLLDLLGEPRFGQWMVIHGHRHVPRIRFASGGNSQAIVFSAGSLSGPLYSTSTPSANQFYIVEFDLEPSARVGLAGRILAWDWHLGSGWAPASAQSGLPHVSGFGWRGSLDVLADAVLSKNHQPFVKWAEVATQLPELQYLMPRDIRSLNQLLEPRGLKITLDEHGCPHEVGVARVS